MAIKVSSKVIRWFTVLAAFVLLPAWASAQEPVTITGRVTGEAGEALGSASVTIPTLNILVYASSDGMYRLVVPAARVQGQQVTVTARMIGHRSRASSVTLTPGTTVERSFQLPTDPLRLEEVVITGAGTQMLAERLGTARSSVDAVTLRRANEGNVVQALAGKVPNVVTNQGSGDAGASTIIQIRGPKTFGTSQPLIVVVNDRR